MKEIILTGNKGVALVDDEWYPVLSKFKWHLTVKGYAARSTRPGFSIMMHRVVNMTPVKLETDHINGNKLDNRAENLRSATGSENCHNRYQARPYRGVSKHKTGKFQASVTVNRKSEYLGLYETRDEAAEVARLRRQELGVSP